MADRALQPGLPPLRLGRAVLVLACAAALIVLAVALTHLRAVAPGPSQFNPLYAVSGLLVGALVGLTGVGGGALMTPLLVLLFHFQPGAAVGTDLLYASATKTVGTAVHGANRTVNWKIVGWMALGSVPATIATVIALYALRAHGTDTAKLISTVLGFALLLTAVTLLVRKQIFAFAERHALQPSPRATTVLTVALGALLGVLITLSSVGAGAIGVTILGLPLSQAAGVADRGLRHRARRAADPDRGVGALGHGFG